MRARVAGAAMVLLVGGCAGQRAGSEAGLAPAPASVAEEQPRSASAASDSRRPRDTALGIDKLQHFLMSGYVQSVVFAGLQAVGVDRDAAFGGASAATAAAGIAKEFHDRRSYGLFSLGDLVWDALGAGAAMLILTRTTR